MNNFFKSFAVMSITLAIILTSCGGGGSDSGGGGGTPAGTFTKEVALVTSIDNNHGILGTNLFRHYQILYKPENIAGSGYIKSLYLKRYETLSTATACPHLTIKMVHTSAGALGGEGTDLNDNFGDKGSPVTVLNDATVTIPAGNADDYFEILLTTQFNYNGVDNLIIDLTRTAACSQEVLVIVGAGTSTYTANAYSGNSSTPDTVGVGFTSENIPHTKFNFAGGDNKVDYNTTHNGNIAPLNTNIGSQKVQMLYNKDSIAGSGLITGIGLQVQTTTANAATYTYTMKLGHSTNTDLVYTWIDNFNAGSPVTVASSISFSIPAGVPANEFIWLPIPDGSFTYNGTDNLVIELTIEAADGNVSLATHTTSNYNRMYGDPADDNAAVRNQYTHQIALRFYGGQVIVLPNVPDGTCAQLLGSGHPGQIQNLYENYLLGTSGTITNVYVRLYQPTPAAASLTNYKVYMGHTTKTAYNMAETYASNMDENAIVFSGTLTVPSGLKQGDWVKIPLSSPFVYNSAKNLSILFTTDAGPSGNIVLWKYDDIVFPSHCVTRDDNSVTSSGNPTWIGHGLVALTMDIVK